MSVKLPDRKPSQADFLHNALALRREMTELLLRDFGVKSKVRDHLREAKMDEASAEKLAIIAENYRMTDGDAAEIRNIIQNCTYEVKELDNYPNWLIGYFRVGVLHSVENLMHELYLGNSIFISEKDCELAWRTRRAHWDAACGELKHLAEWLDYVRQTLPVNANKYDRYLERISRELAMLKALKSSDNKLANAIKKRMAK